MKNIKFKIFFLFFVGFLQISNNFVFGMEDREAKECLICLASTFYVTDDEGNLINKRKDEIHENAEGLRIGSEEDIVPVDSRFKTLVDESDRSKLIPLPDSQIVEISHVAEPGKDDLKHYLHTDCLKENMRIFMQNNPRQELKCITCNLPVQTAFTLDGTQIYPTPAYEIVWENQTTSDLYLKYKINKIEGFSQLKTHILSLEPQRTASQLDLDIDISIHEIPEYFFSGLETLEIQDLCLCNNNLTSLPTSIGELTSLKELWLYSNNLTSLPTSIGELTSLETLSLWNNKLTSLPESIGNLRSLKTLDSALNKLTSLPTSIGQLTNLKSLYLYLNYLIPWPTQILQPLLVKTPQTEIYGGETQLENGNEIDLIIRKNRFFLKRFFLKYKIKRAEGLIPLKNYLLKNQRTYQITIAELTLIIDGNIHTIPEDFFSGLEIEKLWLNDNKLTSLPTSIGSLINLKELCLSRNQLTSLPIEIKNLTSLKKLDLGFNKLTSLPAEIEQLTSLQKLYLNNNKLTSLPTEIGNLTNLQLLNLNLNRLTSLPESIGQLTNLKWLSLSRNQLTSLPIEIENLTSLKKLYLDLNYLIPWPTQILQPLLDKTPQTRIYGEGLQTNNVVPINENIRENRLFLKYKIKRVEGLIPFKNFLLRLQRDTQAKISELNLRIDGNIHTIPEDFFSGLEIEKLWLCNNKLTSLPTSIGSLSNLKELDLYGNSLTSLPESIGNLRSLETLNLDFNKLTSLPTSIGQLGNLKFLWIHFNHLVPWPTETLQHLFSGIDLIVNKYTQTLTKRQIQDWLKRKTRRRRRRYQQIGHHQL